MPSRKSPLPAPSEPVRRRRVPADEADAVLAACRTLVGISVRSLAAVQDQVSVLQLRILTVIASRGTTTLSELAAATGLHISRASRTCDRMVNDGLIDRTENAEDRRLLSLTLTDRGQRLVADVAAARRAAVTPALARMSTRSRAELVEALGELTAAAGEPAEAELWALGWATGTAST